MGQQDFLKQYAKEICTFFENISDHCDMYEAICVCQQTQLSKEKMSCAEYDDKRKKNYIFKLNFWALKRLSPAVVAAENHQNISSTITHDQAS